MRVLITAGNTQTPVDRVRCITNIFTGRTGAQIALEGRRRGHKVTLLTSHPEVAGGADAGLCIVPYRTFDELQAAMVSLIPGGQFDILIHAAAVSDFHVAGTYAPAPGTTFDPESQRWTGAAKLIDVGAGKVKSSHAELWMRLTPTPKLADSVRSPWGFRGTFVKFKLEVGVTDEELLRIARKSRAQSDADWIVANTLEGKDAVAFIVDRNDGSEQIVRADLPNQLWRRLIK